MRCYPVSARPVDSPSWRPDQRTKATKVNEYNGDVTPDTGFYAAARLELSRAGLLGDEES